jgi:hypothetical protein
MAPKRNQKSSRSARPSRPSKPRSRGPRRQAASRPRRRSSGTSLRSRETTVILPSATGVVSSGGPSFRVGSAPMHDLYGYGERLAVTQDLIGTHLESTGSVNRIFNFNSTGSTYVQLGQLGSELGWWSNTGGTVTDGRAPMWNDSATANKHVATRLSLFRKKVVRSLELEWVPTSVSQTSFNVTLGVVHQDYELNVEEKTFSQISSLSHSFTTPVWQRASAVMIPMIRPNDPSPVLYDTVVVDSTRPSQFVIVAALSSLPASSYVEPGRVRAHAVIDMYDPVAVPQTGTIPAEDHAKVSLRDMVLNVVSDLDYVKVERSKCASSASTSSASSGSFTSSNLSSSSTSSLSSAIARPLSGFFH